METWNGISFPNILNQLIYVLRYSCLLDYRPEGILKIGC